MPNRGRKVLLKPITAYLDAEVELTQTGHTDQEEQVPVSLSAFRRVVVQEFGKTETEFRYLRYDICK